MATLVVPAVPGAARPATVVELDLVARWVGALHHLTGLAKSDSPRETRAPFARRVGEGDVFVGEADGEAAALAGVVGLSDDTAAPLSRLGPVYSVPGAPRRRYGAAVTAALASREVGRGRGVVLDADAETRRVTSPIARSASSRVPRPRRSGSARPRGRAPLRR